MKKVLKKLLGVTLAMGAVFTVTVSSYAEESSQEIVVVDLEEVEELAKEESKEAFEQKIVATVVMITMESEYSFLLDEEGNLLSIEGEKEELIGKVLEKYTKLEEAIKAILESYGEEVSYEIMIIVEDEETGAAILESLSEAIGEEKVEIVVVESEDLEVENDETENNEIETEQEGRPEFITKRFELANQLGITPGKMNLLEKLAGTSNEEVNYEEWSQKSVKEIMFEIKANRAKTDTKTYAEADLEVIENQNVQEDVEKDKKEQSIQQNKGNSQSQGQSQGKSQGQGNSQSNGKGKNK
jgi:hypothetical protein